MASPALNLIGLAAGFALIAWFCSFRPPATTYQLSKTAEPPTDRELILLTASGREFARRGGCFGRPVSIGEVPEHFIDALLSMEDRRFYSHIGIDPIGAARAAAFNYRAGKVAQGGSTITQQLAKQAYLTGTKTFARKLEEAVIALRLEAGLTKDQILERYLSRAYFGDGCYGLRAAARHRFDRSVGELTIAQSAYLVALLRSPSYYARQPDELHRRERLVLQAMVDAGQLDEATLKTIKPAVEQANNKKKIGAYYADWIAQTVKLPEEKGLTALPVRTSFEPVLQRIAERAVRNAVRRFGRHRQASQAALVAMRPDGRVVAMVGGVNHGRSQFNRATQALRQPGSSFKSFVYLAAMRAAANPEMLVFDAPVTIGDWSPENYSHGYRGIVSLQTAYSSSINTVAVRVSEAVGRDRVVAAARDLGITTPLTSGPSIALGTSEVTLLELTSAYAAFAADAYPVKPWGIISLGARPAGGGRPPKEAGKWRLLAGDRMRTLLAATVEHGTGRAARLPIPSYGKTGTSQNYRDAWFIGFAGNLVVGVWLGNDDNSPMRRVTGGSVPALIWRDFMNEARHKDRRFTARLPGTIAAFRSARAHRSFDVASSRGLESLLIPPMQQFALDGSYRAQYDRAMLLGRPYGAMRQPAYGYPRQPYGATQSPAYRYPRPYSRPRAPRPWVPWHSSDGS